MKILLAPQIVIDAYREIMRPEMVDCYFGKEPRPVVIETRSARVLPRERGTPTTERD